MSKSDELARLLENAEQLIRSDIIKYVDDFLKELYTNMLITLVDTNKHAVLGE
jgi:hypothetical protein